MPSHDTQSAFTCSKATLDTPKQCVKAILLKLFCCQKDSTHCSDVSTVDFDKANVGWLSTQPDFPILIFLLK